MLIINSITIKSTNTIKGDTNLMTSPLISIWHFYSKNDSLNKHDLINKQKLFLIHYVCIHKEVS